MFRRMFCTKATCAFLQYINGHHMPYSQFVKYVDVKVSLASSKSTQSIVKETQYISEIVMLPDPISKKLPIKEASSDLRYIVISLQVSHMSDN